MVRELAIFLSPTKGILVIFLVACLLLIFVASIISHSGKNDRREALLLAFFFVELASVFILLSFAFESDLGIDSNPRLAPWLWGGSLFICALLQFIKIWRAKEYQPVRYGHLGKVFAALTIVTITISLFQKLGFFISTGAMIVTLMLMMGERRKILITAASCLWMLTTWLIFNKLLFLNLPTGSLLK